MSPGARTELAAVILARMSGFAEGKVKVRGLYSLIRDSMKSLNQAPVTGNWIAASREISA
jgi:hypothetical protein